MLSVEPKLLYLMGDPITVWGEVGWSMNKLELRRKLYSLRLNDGQKHIKAMTEPFNGLSVAGAPLSLASQLSNSHNMSVTAREEAIWLLSYEQERGQSPITVENLARTVTNLLKLKRQSQATRKDRQKANLVE